MTLINKIHYCLQRKKGLTAGEIVYLVEMRRCYMRWGRYPITLSPDRAEAIYDRLKKSKPFIQESK